MFNGLLFGRPSSNHWIRGLQMLIRSLRGLVAAALLALALPVSAFAQAVPASYTEPFSLEKAISGTMSATFNTRTNKDRTGKLPAGSPAIGQQDIYQVNLQVAKSTFFDGTIKRQPWIPTATLGTTAQVGFLEYTLRTGVINPANPTQTRVLGSLIGGLSLDNEGKYHLTKPPAGMGELRMAIESAGPVPGFVSKFGGEIEGRVPESAGALGFLAKAKAKGEKHFALYVEGRPVKATIKNSDPVGFQNVKLASGPVAGYPEVILNGSMDFDPENSVWYLDLQANYGQKPDRFSGTIRWIDDPKRAQNGLGYYDLNVRVNEQAISEAEILKATAASEDDFFKADSKVPGFSGKILYKDTFQGKTVTGSAMTYEVDAHKVSKIQMMTLAKLLFLAVGPFNDE
ncbi:hypothetical protein K8Q93_02635 [Candidatus Parcubacteria bacterium]|nr:hypothetical protein [Candidatus Parcubacteria bacterium]